MQTDSILNHFHREIFHFISNDTETLVLALDKDLKVVYANQKSLQILGQHIVDKPFKSLLVEFHPEVDLNISTQQIQFSTSIGLPQAYATKTYHEKEYFLIVATVNTLELEQLRKELIESNNDLNNLMRELHKKNAELIQLNEIKNRFVGIVAHDLKSPLNGMSIICDFLDTDVDSLPKDKVNKYLGMLNSQIRFMVDLINDILDLSAIESGKLTLNLSTCNLMSLILDSLSFHRMAYEEESIEILTNFHSSSCNIFVDKIKIRQSVDNIIVNALKFTPTNGCIEIATDADERWIRIHVSDEGPGIAEEDIPHVFKPFRQAKSATEAKAKGTGLGLSIVEKIVKAHKGTVVVKNNPNKGCTFTIQLPINGESDENIHDA